MSAYKKMILLSILAFVCSGNILDSCAAVQNYAVSSETSAFTPIPIEIPTETPAKTPVITPTFTPLETPTARPTETFPETPSAAPTPKIKPTHTPTSSPTPIILSSGLVSVSGAVGRVNRDIVIPVKAQRIKNVRKFTVDINEHVIKKLAKVETPVETPTETPSETPSETPVEKLLKFKRIEINKTMIDKYKFVTADVLPNDMGVRITAQNGTTRSISGNGTLFKLIYTAEKAGKTLLQINGLGGDLAKSHPVNIAGLVKINPSDITGDIDQDGVITSADVLLLLKYLARQVMLTPAQLKAADCNQDRKVDLKDVQWIFNLSIGLSNSTDRTIEKSIFHPFTASSLSLSDKTVNAGDTFTLDAMVSGASDISAFSFDVTYDASKLEFVTVQTPGTLTDNFAVFGNEISAGKAIILGVQGSSPAAVKGSGIFIKLVLRAKGNTSGTALVGLENFVDGLQGATGTGASITIQSSSVQPAPTPTSTPISGIEDFTLSLGSKTISSGETTTVDVTVSGNPSSIFSYTLDFAFDPALLSYVGVIKTGTLSENASIGANLVSEGLVSISGLMPTSNSKATNGVLFKLQIKALSGASGTAMISLENLQADIKDAIAEDSAIDIIPGVPGDTDGNDDVDMHDIYFFSTFWMMVNPADAVRSDINNDAVIDQYDLLQLREYWK